MISKAHFNVFLIGGARPNFVKIAALARAFDAFRKKHSQSRLRYFIIHTGQHYDVRMDKVFFKDLKIPKPYINLRAGSSSHGRQTGIIMSRFEELVLRQRPDLVMVVGDVNSTLACALVCAKLGIPVAHVEAGLRSFDRSMPEEINRLVTDRVSDFLFTTSKDASVNLQREGVNKEKIFFVGNVMVDTLLFYLKKARGSRICDSFQLKEPYALLTLHRPSNVDKDKDLQEIFLALEKLNHKMPIVFPVHPRTAARLRTKSMAQSLKKLPSLKMVPPVGYLDFTHLLNRASLVLTDSGGIQEESTILRVPCITLRENTERPVTITHGTNILAGKKSKKIIRLALKIIESSKRSSSRKPPLWDGRAAQRIVKVLDKTYHLK